MGEEAGSPFFNFICGLQQSCPSLDDLKPTFGQLSLVVALKKGPNRTGIIGASPAKVRSRQWRTHHGRSSHCPIPRWSETGFQSGADKRYDGARAVCMVLDCKTVSVGMKSRRLSVTAAGGAADACFARRSDFSRRSGGGRYLFVWWSIHPSHLRIFQYFVGESHRD